MEPNFQVALKFTSKWEGGWSDDPADPGGKTMYGITEMAYHQYFPDKDVSECTPDEAKFILKDGYWDKPGCPSLPLPEAVAVFDTAVNCGVSRAKRWLKQSKDINQFLDLRRIHYYTISANNPDLKKFMKGWINRLNDLKKYVEILKNEG